MTEEMWRQKVGDRIRTARQAREMSQEKLAEKLDVSFQAVSTWEQGKIIPDTGHLLAMARELGLSLDALFAEEDSTWELKPVNYDPEHMKTFVKGRAQMLNLPQTLKVLDLLEGVHGAKVRWSLYGFDTQYTVHPLTMACHALAMGIRDDNVIAACLAHDMVEDHPDKTKFPEQHLEELPVNEQVREAVRLVSKNLCNHAVPDWEDRYYEKIRENPLACLVKCLDRTHNLVGLADGFERDKMREYTEETDRYYPALLEVLKKTPEYNDAWWLLRYQMMSMTETFKRML